MRVQIFDPIREKITYSIASDERLRLERIDCAKKELNALSEELKRLIDKAVHKWHNDKVSLNQNKII